MACTYAPDDGTTPPTMLHNSGWCCAYGTKYTMHRSPMPKHIGMYLHAQVLLEQVEHTRSQLCGTSNLTQRTPGSENCFPPSSSSSSCACLPTLAYPQRLSVLHANAISLLKRVTAIDPGMMLAHYALGLALMDSGEKRGASAAFRAAADSCASTMLLSDAAVNFKEEAARATTAVHVGGRDGNCMHTATLSSMAWWLSRCADHAGAAAVLRRVVAERPHDAEAQYELGLALSCQVREGNHSYGGSFDTTTELARSTLSSAELALRRAISCASPVAQYSRDRSLLVSIAHMTLGQVEEMSGRFASAATSYRRAIAADPGNSKALGVFDQYLARMAARAQDGDTAAAAAAATATAVATNISSRT